MIRINLLPVKQVRRVQASQRQLVLFLVLLLAEVGLMFALYQWQSSEVAARKREVTKIQGEIEQLKKEVGDFDRLRQERDRLLAQRNVITKLEKGRTGPVYMLRELSDILSPGKGPTVNQDAYEAAIRQDPNAGYNPRWNPHRLWVDRLDENGGRLRLTGKAKDYDDVAELLKRLQWSVFFDGVQLGRQQQVKDSALGLKVVRFTLTCQVKY